MATLASARVKSILSTSQIWNKFWHHYCESKGGGKHDPDLQPPEFVQAFLEEHARSRGCLLGELQNELEEEPQHKFKEHQISVSVRAAALRRKAVPARPSSSPEVVASVSFVSSRAPQNCKPLEAQLPAFTHIPGHAELVARVKFTLEENGAIARDAWSRACSTQGGGRLDPSMHHPAFLAKFVEEVGQLAADASGMVEEVKQLQRSSAVGKAAWHQYCQTQGRLSDPKKHEVWFLRNFLDWWKTVGSKSVGPEQTQKVQRLDGLSGSHRLDTRSSCEQPAKRVCQELQADAKSAKPQQLGGRPRPEQPTQPQGRVSIRGEAKQHEEMLHPGSVRFCVEGCAAETMDADLEEHFASYGEIREAFIVKDQAATCKGVVLLVPAELAENDAQAEDKAQRVIDEVNRDRHEICGKLVQVHATSKPSVHKEPWGLAALPSVVKKPRGSIAAMLSKGSQSRSTE